MVEPAPAVVLRPVRRAVAPPGEAALGSGHEAATDVNPVVRLLQPCQRLDLDRRVADDAQQRLVTPDVAFERGDVEVADDDGRFLEALGPARHAPDEVELLPEFWIEEAIGRVAAGGDVNILEPD